MSKTRLGAAATVAIVLGAGIAVGGIASSIARRIRDHRVRWLRSPRYRLHDATGDDLGVIKHPAPNVEPGDVVMLADGREALVTSRVEVESEWLTAMLEVAVVPSPLEADAALP
jgi:hypothetical protein